MWFRKLNSNRGFSLVEVLISAGLMALVASGLVGLVTNMNKEQNSQFRLAALRELKTRFQFLITDQNSWNRTLQKNADDHADTLALCIKNKTVCATGVRDLRLYDSGGLKFFEPLPSAVSSPSYAANEGFTEKGTKCTTFNGNTGAGVDTCPISYKVVWEPICPPSGACRNPLVKITVRLIYNPGSTSRNAVLSLGAGNLTTGAFSTDDSTAINTGRYDVVMKRSSTAVNKAFTLQITSAAAATGGGTCVATPGFGIRGDTTSPRLSPPWQELSDDFELVSRDATTGVISIIPGTYSCRITSVGWAVNTFTTQLRATSPSAVVPGSIATSNASATGTDGTMHSQSTATSNPIISIGGITPATYVVEQSCATPDYVVAADRKYNMGLPSGYSASLPSVFSTFTCTQTN